MQRRAGIVPSLVAGFALVAGLLTGVPSSAAAAVPALRDAAGGSSVVPLPVAPGAADGKPQGGYAYTYDVLNRMVGATPGASSGNQASSYTYDTLGNLVKETTGSQSVTRAFNDANQLVSVTDEKQVTSFGYDGRGNRTSEMLPNGKTASYTYDAADRLAVGVSVQGSQSVYSFDALGVRVGLTQINNGGQGYVRSYVNGWLGVARDELPT